MGSLAQAETVHQSEEGERQVKLIQHFMKRNILVPIHEEPIS